MEKSKIHEELQRIREELLKRKQNNVDEKANTDPLKKEKTKKNKSERKHKKKDKKSDREKYKHGHRSSLDKNEISSSSLDKQIVIEEAITPANKTSPEVTRDDWMTSSMLIKTFSKNKTLQKKQSMDTYEPGKSSRELNPHWKDGGSGLPSFRKPKDDSDEDEFSSYKSYKSAPRDWIKKTETNVPEKICQEQSESLSPGSEKETAQNFLTDQQMNELGAKIMKAEIMNNKELADEFKNKLNSARLLREQIKDKNPKLLSKQKDEKYLSDRLKRRKDDSKYEKDIANHEKPHTNVSGKRVRNFEVDSRDELKNKFERENKTKGSAKNAKEHKQFKEDLDDIFATDSANPDDRNRYARREKRLNKKLNNCDKCFDVDKMNKQLVVSVGKHVYLALPWHEGLQTNHCLIIPMDHYTCSTELDEDVWEEISSYRKVLTKLFTDRKQDVLFFETARYLQKKNHMVVHCLPASSIEMAPFYFKKAILESEYEWSTNKQLVKLKEKSLIKSIPSGLAYFWVHFGMDFGFAHVIENQENFPSNFAQEIIGGMLHLDMSKWRRPKQLQNVETKVKNLADLLKPYNI